MKSNWMVMVLAFAAGHAGAGGVVGGPAPSADAVRQADKPGAVAAHADDSASMREGVITGVSEKRDQLEINGSWLRLSEGTTRVFRQGRAVKRDELAKGQKVKFTLATGVADRSTLGVVYVP